MTTLDDVLTRVLDSMPVARWLQLSVDDVTPDRAVLSMPVVPDVTFDGVHCHGGIVAMLADIAAVGAAYAAIHDSGRVAATTAMNSHNLRPARGERLVAVGRLVGPPGRTLIAAADVFTDSLGGTRCLTGLYTATALDRPLSAPAG